MSANPAKARLQEAASIAQNLELVQPRRIAEAPLEERQQIKEKIKVRAAARKAMAVQEIAARGSAGKKARESRLIPAEGGKGMTMGMGMHVD